MLKIDSELVRLSMRIGYAAAWKGLSGDALKIFKGVGAVRPESEVPLIGAAVIGMLSGDFEMSGKALDHALEANPENDLIRAHLGCLMRLRGEEEEGRKLLVSISEDSNDPSAKALAFHLKDRPAGELLPSRNGSSIAPGEQTFERSF